MTSAYVTRKDRLGGLSGGQAEGGLSSATSMGPLLRDESATSTLASGIWSALSAMPWHRPAWTIPGRGECGPGQGWLSRSRLAYDEVIEVGRRGRFGNNRNQPAGAQLSQNVITPKLRRRATGRSAPARLPASSGRSGPRMRSPRHAANWPPSSSPISAAWTPSYTTPAGSWPPRSGPRAPA